ncbi:MAG: hypothetical protein FDX18_06935, partial [Chlorobium sp.]
MKPLFVFITSTIILSALALAVPDLLLNPGPLMQGHQTLKRQCLECHKPFSGASALQCITCHKQNDISVRNVAGKLLPKDSTKVLFHRGLSATSCVDCHADHKGVDAAKAVKPFMHSALSHSLQKECITCHKNQKPEDAVHRYAKGNCSDCHSSKNWKPATFDHATLTAASARQCIDCHKTDQPNDELHLKFTLSCSECHSTKKWKPATFDHSKLTAA